VSVRAEAALQLFRAFFVERVDDASRQKYEVRYTDPDTGVAVTPVFVATD